MLRIILISLTRFTVLIALQQGL